jgi:hypothetical protein
MRSERATTSLIVAPEQKRTSITLALSAPDSNDMDAPTMLLELHERGIHAV